MSVVSSIPFALLNQCASSVLSVLYSNARSLLPKMDNLADECAVHYLDIVCITATWLDQSISDGEIALDGYSVIHLGRNRHGGGILLFVKSLQLIIDSFLLTHARCTLSHSHYSGW